MHNLSKPSLHPFRVASNLVDPDLREGYPWDFAPGAERLAEMRALKKERRTEKLAKPACQWQTYTPVVGVNPGRRVAENNQAAAVSGLVADYDVKTDRKVVEDWVGQMPLALQPQFIETSLSAKLRLVWVFERSLPVRDTQHAEAFLSICAQKMRLATALPGYDAKSEKASQVWTNGGEWQQWRKEPMAWDMVFGFATDTADKLPDGRAEVPLELIAEEIERRWPGCWRGELTVDSRGVRFWDRSADNETGCQVKPDGMLCFTGPIGFMSWASLLGGKWLDAQRALNLGRIAGETYFDGSVYHQKKSGVWHDVRREDMLLDLKARGMSTTKMRGQTVSDAERVLHHIQNANRVHGAAPLIYHRPGVIDLFGYRLLNVSTIRPVDPAGHSCTPRDFEFLWDYLNGLFLARPGMYPLETWMAWQRRSYIALREHEQLMGQALFLCGPPENGKTLLCAHVIAPLLGGRMVNPYLYLTGKTDFTDDLFGSAFWCINDEESPTDEKAKNAMQAKLKAATVNPAHPYHPKFCKKQVIPWQGRIVVTTNDDAQSIGILPEVNESTRDKLMFFATQPYKKVWPERRVIESTLARELPCFARYLLDWTPPPEVLAPGRMGVKSYFDPRILELSKQQSYSYNLLELLVTWARLAPELNDKPTWQGTPTDWIASAGALPNLNGIILRDWTAAKVAKNLTSLARIGSSGVEFVEGGNERLFRIHKNILLKAA